MVSVVKRDTTTNIVGAIQNDMNLTTGTTATVTYNALAATRIWGTVATGNTDWTGGTYTWRYRVVTANSTITITQVRLIRYASDGTTIRASKSSGAISISCSTTGVKSSTIVWNDGTQNPVGRQSTDLFAIEFTTASSGHGTQNIGVGTNLSSTNDEIDTPLSFAQNFNGNITEGSVSVSETLDRVQGIIKTISESSISVNQTLDRIQNIIRTIAEDSVAEDDTITRAITYLKSISEDAVNEDDSVSGTKQSGTTGQVFDVSLVEFPEAVLDELEGFSTETIIDRFITEDAITVDQTLTVIKNAVRSLNEDVDIEETLIRVLSAIRSPSEGTITINDTVVRILSALRSLPEDAITINQTLERVLQATRSVEESKSIDDSVAGLLLRLRSITEDAITVDQTLSRILAAIRSPTEDVDIDQTLIRNITTLRSISETAITTNDVVESLNIIVRTISETALNVSEVLERLLSSFRTLTEPEIDVDETLVKSVTRPATITEDPLNINDALVRVFNAIRILLIDVSVTEQLTRIFSTSRSINEPSITLDEVLATLFIEFGGAIKLAGGYPDKSKIEIAQILINLLKQEWGNS